MNENNWKVIGMNIAQKSLDLNAFQQIDTVSRRYFLMFLFTETDLSGRAPPEDVTCCASREVHSSSSSWRRRWRHAVYDDDTFCRRRVGGWSKSVFLRRLTQFNERRSIAGRVDLSTFCIDRLRSDEFYSFRDNLPACLGSLCLRASVASLKRKELA